ncbi:MAG: hypothetical protein E5X53_00365 [Mesorhizobium sp.]|uniref:hypothetical protein n=1 Tax=Mesorhizobium sp. TaxID=1871066 RepID=UPI001213C72E|nr:hypothetical protein [Mesorhizobium sp.]TIP71937.1 MAG: hypothetical protein E5X55_20115 [Mesorhizobium sp.]TIQ14891.1 MAG: hypothetical protein E5X57_02815 [Mesorhizobium sp.]TIR54326.1 MAG: hypothetical protein E5X53_00365 [Mesorhizobium sp.]TJV99916.1 MAG: hypothetical protein E5X52_04535 [Mesorhizobium sp.]
MSAGIHSIPAKFPASLGEMAQSWWVNHNLTVRREIDGQHLWSPKTENNGARSGFYNNIRRATPGDLALSYVDQAVRYIGPIAAIHLVSGSANQKAYLTGIPQNTFELVIAGATFSHEALPRGGSNSLTFEAINELLDDIVEPRIADDDQLEALSRRASSLDPLG